jgi:hypothetical protein
MLRGLLVTVSCLGLAACGASDSDTDSLPASGGAGDECGETIPVIEALVVEDAGMSEGDECGAEIRPRLRVGVEASDADGDLHYYTLKVWYDDVVDGEVLPEGDRVFQVDGPVGEGDACSVLGANVGMLLCVTGDPPFATEIEFGVVVFDDMDNASSDGDPQEFVFTTPDASGAYAP